MLFRRRRIDKEQKEEINTDLINQENTKINPLMVSFALFVFTLLVALVCYPFAEFSSIAFLVSGKLALNTSAEICLSMFIFSIIFFILWIYNVFMEMTK